MKTKDELYDVINEMITTLSDLADDIENLEEYHGIKNIDNFKFELLKNGLLDTKLINFIDIYLQYHNE